jgi:endonuclease/exonuclease/phosphatase family metal-dependent hydrolase
VGARAFMRGKERFSAGNAKASLVPARESTASDLSRDEKKERRVLWYPTQANRQKA